MQPAFVGEPALAAISGHLDVYGLGTDMSYHHRSWANGWARGLDGIGGTYIGPPVASYQGTTTVDVVGQLANQSFDYRQLVNGVGFGDLLPIANGGGIGTVSLAQSPTGASVDLLIGGGDHAMWENVLTGSTWGGWHAGFATISIH